MNGFAAPPSAYGEWIAFFEYTKANSQDTGLFRMMRKGTLNTEGVLTERFLIQITEHLNAVLQRRMALFCKKLNECLEFQDPESISVLFGRLKNDLKEYMYFTGLQFINEDFRRDMYGELKTQVSKYYFSLMLDLEGQASEFRNERLEDAIYRIKRVSLLSIFDDMEAQWADI